MTLDEFTRRVAGFASMSHPEKIKLFAWYLHTERGHERFEPVQINTCYDDAHLQRPGNLHSFLNQLLDRKPPVFLRDSGGYRLEARIRQALDSQYGRTRDQVEMSKLVTDLVARIPGIAERVFLEETIACYRYGAFRAAIVMAWALTMDHVFEWLLADASRLARFNAAIPVRYPKKGALTIAARGEFQELKESEVIDVLRSSDLITKDMAKVLHEKLDRRNTAAHPSTVVVTQAQAEDVVTDLVNNVVLALK